VFNRESHPQWLTNTGDLIYAASVALQCSDHLQKSGWILEADMKLFSRKAAEQVELWKKAQQAT